MLASPNAEEAGGSDEWGRWRRREIHLHALHSGSFAVSLCFAGAGDEKLTMSGWIFPELLWKIEGKAISKNLSAGFTDYDFYFYSSEICLEFDAYERLCRFFVKKKSFFFYYFYFLNNWKKVICLGGHQVI